jgi:Protein of unknown function (DUF2934)
MWAPWGAHSRAVFDPFRFSRRYIVSAKEREKLISDAAYFRCAARGFKPGYDLEDWLAAEAHTDDLLMHRLLRYG